MASSRGTQNGPDWTDISRAMGEVSQFHNVEIAIHVQLPVHRADGKMHFVGVCTRRGTVKPGVKPSVSRSVLIGSTDQVADTARIFRLIHELDRDCTQMWYQAGLFENA